MNKRSSASFSETSTSHNDPQTTGQIRDPELDDAAHTHDHCHDSAPHSHDHNHGEATHCHTHTHDHCHDGAPHAHTHSHDGVHTHSHSHTHDPRQIRAIVNRLSRSIGHLESVKRMVENNVDCSDVLIQLAAVRAELTNAGKILLKEHLEHCIVEAVAENDPVAIEKMNAAIDKFMK